MKDVLDKVNSYLFLGEDWDGYGGSPPPKSIVDNCVSFIKLLSSNKVSDVPTCQLTEDGEVALYWYVKDKYYFEIGFHEPHGGSYYLHHEGQDIQERAEDDISHQSLMKVVKEILA